MAEKDHQSIHARIERAVAAQTKELRADKNGIEAALRASEAENERLTFAIKRLRAMVNAAIENTPLGCVMYDADLRITEWNPAAERLFGYSKDEVLGRSPLDFLVPRDVLEEVQPVLRRMYSGESDVHKINDNLTKSGRRITCEWFNSALLDDRGNVVSFAAFVRDVTAERLAEQQRAQNQKLESLGLLAGGIAHDFNNILTAVLGNAETAIQDSLRAPDHGDELRHSLNQIIAASNRGKEIIDQILAFSSGRGQVVRPVNLTRVITDTIDLIQSALPEEVEIDAELPDGACVVDGHETQLMQVLLNLCTNASQAMESDGGVLTIELSTVRYDGELAPLSNPIQADEYAELVVPTAAPLAPGEYLELTVSDTGPGMDEATLERIFDPYFTTKDPSHGTGLGLAVVRGIIEDHRGCITVYSRIGMGTAIRVLIPLSAAPLDSAEPVAADSMADSESPIIGARVLLVDDDEAVLDIAERELVRLGYDVVACSTGAEALDALRADPDGFDLVLTDQAMPGHSGTSLAKACTQMRPDLPIAIFTAFANHLVPEELADLRIRDVLRKPFTRMELARFVRRALAQG